MVGWAVSTVEDHAAIETGTDHTVRSCCEADRACTVGKIQERLTRAHEEEEGLDRVVVVVD
jgi:hypothetical protein